MRIPRGRRGNINPRRDMILLPTLRLPSRRKRRGNERRRREARTRRRRRRKNQKRKKLKISLTTQCIGVFHSIEIEIWKPIKWMMLCVKE
ncbi:hypothetical protein Ciccas_013677 [Cichlidogyrus casuarinus]|uniref:Uncharacterized protein n=1 Tax=Cichlidogyrus casuarinus TaxID=1844966 RepID=A0ABD2PK14_9PLAT